MARGSSPVSKGCLVQAHSNAMVTKQMIRARVVRMLTKEEVGDPMITVGLRHRLMRTEKEPEACEA